MHDRQLGIINHPEKKLAAVENQLHKSLLYRSLQDYGKSFQTSEQPFNLTNKELEELVSTAQASREYHRVINQAYFDSLSLSEKGGNGPIVEIHQIVDRVLPRSALRIMRANPQALPLFCRDDLLLTANSSGPRFMLGESEGAKLTGFGAAVLFDQLRNSIINHQDRIPGIDLVAASRIREVNSQMGNNNSPVLTIVGEKDGFHLSDYATFTTALRNHGVEAYLIHENSLNPNMITDQGIILPDVEYPARVVLNYPNTERLAEGNSLASNPVREGLLEAYANESIIIAIPPKPLLGLKVSRAIIQDKNPEVKAFLAAIAGGKEQLEFIRAHIPQVQILRGTESEQEIEGKFIKSTGRSGEGGVAGPGPEHRERRKLFLEETRRQPVGSYVVEETVETKRVVITKGGKPFTININGETIEECYLRINSFRVNFDDSTIPSSILVTGRHIPHVHTTEDSVMVAASAGPPHETQGPITNIFKLPESKEDLKAITVTKTSPEDIVDMSIWDNALIPFDDVPRKGRINNLIYSMISPEFRNRIDNYEFPDALSGRSKGIKTILDDIIKAASNVARSDFISDRPSKDNRGVITLTNQEAEALYRTTKWWVEIQQFNTPKNKVGRKPKENIELLETILTKELKGEPIKAFTAICPGYASGNEGFALSGKILREKSQPLKDMLRNFIQKDMYPNFELTLGYSGTFEMVPEFMQGMDQEVLERAVEVEMQEVSSFFSDLGEVVYLSDLIDTQIYGQIKERLFHDEIPRHSSYDSRMAYWKRALSTGPFYRNMELAGEQIDIERQARNFDASYAALSVMLKVHGYDLILNTEGPVRRWGYGVVRQLDLMEPLPAEPVHEVWAAADNEMVWKIDADNIIK